MGEVSSSISGLLCPIVKTTLDLPLKRGDTLFFKEASQLFLKNLLTFFS
ncbi:hypothetical protein BREVNS_1549 [Brevinematales bacterium NS]|nr:hypothetical protein BREVNS_1549 [Brevinematales bacterium NS]